MSDSERAREQARFMAPRRRTVMVATNAFGLGVHHPNIRYVLHAQSPASLEQYVQEAGRAGRDGRKANCILLFSASDRAIHEALQAKSRIRPDKLVKLASALAAWKEEARAPTLEALAVSADLGARTTEALVALGEEAGLVRWRNGEVELAADPARVEEQLRRLAGKLQTLRSEDARRLDSVEVYAGARECRAQHLRRHFGEMEGEPCGICDVCRGALRRPAEFFAPYRKRRMREVALRVPADRWE
jgi:ATP-dependent DNA helicase RecQ